MLRALAIVWLVGCAASPAPVDDEAAAIEHYGRQTWEAMDPEQRECHLRYFRQGHRLQIGDGMCESLL